MLPGRAELVEAALPHVPFSGWSRQTLRAAARELGIDDHMVRLLCPRGCVDLAVHWHRAGDKAMQDAVAAIPLEQVRIHDRITRAVQLRLEQIDNREVARRSAALFAMPQHAPVGAELIWGTADAVWTAIGDSSDDINWYTKRATLSAVYSATLLYWLGDGSEGAQATHAFLDRRIAAVVEFGKTTSRLRQTAPGKWLACCVEPLLRNIRPPAPHDSAPGHQSTT